MTLAIGLSLPSGRTGGSALTPRPLTYTGLALTFAGLTLTFNA